MNAAQRSILTTTRRQLIHEAGLVFTTVDDEKRMLKWAANISKALNEPPRETVKKRGGASVQTGVTE